MDPLAMNTVRINDIHTLDNAMDFLNLSSEKILFLFSNQTEQYE